MAALNVDAECAVRTVAVMPSLRLFLSMIGQWLRFHHHGLIDPRPDRYSEILCAQRNFPCTSYMLLGEVQNWPITDLSRCESQLVSLSTYQTSPDLD